MTLTAVGLGVGVYLTRPKSTAPFAGTTAPTGLYTLSTGTLTVIPTAPPPAVPVDGTYEATPQTTLPSLNVSELLNENK